MSYSFGAAKATKGDLIAAISDEIASVVAAQPVHATDAAQAIQAATSLLLLMEDDPARDIAVSMSGSIWKTDAGVQTLSLSVNLGYSARAAIEEAPPEAELAGKPMQQEAPPAEAPAAEEAAPPAEDTVEGAAV